MADVTKKSKKDSEPRAVVFARSAKPLVTLRHKDFISVHGKRKI